jgi:cytochrome o ubiquinol oxidase subunit 1
MKRRGYSRPLAGFKSIHMPSNTGTGFVLAALSTTLAFGMIWYIWWLVAASFLALLAVAIGHTFNYHRDFDIPAGEVLQSESTRTRMLAAGGNS